MLEKMLIEMTALGFLVHVMHGGDGVDGYYEVELHDERGAVASTKDRDLMVAFLNVYVLYRKSFLAVRKGG